MPSAAATVDCHGVAVRRENPVRVTGLPADPEADKGGSCGR